MYIKSCLEKDRQEISVAAIVIPSREVYLITFEACEIEHIGETRRPFCVRIEEHLTLKVKLKKMLHQVGKEPTNPTGRFLSGSRYPCTEIQNFRAQNPSTLVVLKPLATVILRKSENK